VYDLPSHRRLDAHRVRSHEDRFPAGRRARAGALCGVSHEGVQGRAAAMRRVPRLAVSPLSPLRGERVRVRGESCARAAPHPNPLPAERGEGTEACTRLPLA
jgi:hypothetical protein